MIGILGINHKTASLDIRERFSISMEEIGPLAEKILRETEIAEVVILSTCNRTEIYYYQENSHVTETNRLLIEFLHNFKHITSDHTNAFYTYKKLEAIKHLFRVVSGMDSMIIGEDQIVKQVKDSYLYCTEQAFTDAVLMRLFQKSFETGKRVRSETNIQQGATSISSTAVDLCSKLFNDLPEKKVMLLGSGESGRLALQHLQKRGVGRFVVSNRTFEKAEFLAKNYKAEAVPFEKFKNHMAQCDFIITATSAPNYLIDKTDVLESNRQRGGKPQVFIDLSVPRNIDKSIMDVENIKLIAVDDLQSITENTSQMRLDSLEKSEAIIEEMSAEYLEWFDKRALQPVIKAITSGLQKIKQTELEKNKKCYAPDVYESIEEYTDRLTQKYIRSFIKNLKKISENGQTMQSLKTINEFFVFDD